MKYILIMALLLFCFAGNAFGPIGRCDCSSEMDAFQKGDLRSLLIEKNKLRITLIDNRLSIMHDYLNGQEIPEVKRSRITASVNELKRIKGTLSRLMPKLKTAKIQSREEFMSYLALIQDKSGLGLRTSSKILFGSYHGDIPPLFIIKPGGSNCEEDESPPEMDCTIVAQRVNQACMDGIEQKMDCGYYAGMGNDGQNQLNQDLFECTTAMENSMASCQRAIEACDNAYNPQNDQYDFWRRASLSCTLKEMLNNPLQTQTSNGN